MITIERQRRRERDAKRSYACMRDWRLLPGHFDWHDQPGYFERVDTPPTAPHKNGTT